MRIFNLAQGLCCLGSRGALLVLWQTEGYFASIASETPPAPA